MALSRQEIIDFAQASNQAYDDVPAQIIVGTDFVPLFLDGLSAEISNGVNGFSAASHYSASTDTLIISFGGTESSVNRSFFRLIISSLIAMMSQKHSLRQLAQSVH